MINPIRVASAWTIGLLVMVLLVGCGSNRPPEPKPQFDPGEGAITGKLVDAYDDPFDVSLAGEAKSLEIELISPSRGIAAATFPDKDKSTFVLSHIKPGRYELSVYCVVAGKRTIAGSTQITVNPEQVTDAKVPITVTPVKPDAQ
jgi:hypothetical protein